MEMSGIWMLMFFGLPKPRHHPARVWMVTDGCNNWTLGGYKTVNGEYQYHQTQAGLRTLTRMPVQGLKGR